MNARRRVPTMDEITVTRLINGPEAFTPDNEFCLGETEVRGLFVAAGFCAHGLAGAGGMGKLMAEWILAGEPGMDVWEMDVRRFGAQYRSPRYTLARTREVYETYYDIKYPGHERQAGRPLRVSSAYPWHVEHGAAFGEKSGWERVNWYEANAADGDEVAAAAGLGGAATGRPRSRPSTAPRASAPGSSTSRRSPRSRWPGPGAAAFLESLCDNRVARDVGAHHLHADAQRPRRHRVRLHRDARGGGAVLDRHGDGVRHPRPVLAAPPRAARRLGAGRRRHGAVGVLRAVGAGARATSSPPLTPDPARLRLHDRCATSRSATCPCGRCA